MPPLFREIFLCICHVKRILVSWYLSERLLKDEFKSQYYCPQAVIVSIPKRQSPFTPSMCPDDLHFGPSYFLARFWNGPRYFIFSFFGSFLFFSVITSSRMQFPCWLLLGITTDVIHVCLVIKITRSLKKKFPGMSKTRKWFPKSFMYID